METSNQCMQSCPHDSELKNLCRPCRGRRFLTAQLVLWLVCPLTLVTIQKQVLLSEMLLCHDFAPVLGAVEEACARHSQCVMFTVSYLTPAQGCSTACARWRGSPECCDQVIKTLRAAVMLSHSLLDWPSSICWLAQNQSASNLSGADFIGFID